MPLQPHLDVEQRTALDALMELLPKGELWPRDPDSNLAGLLNIFASEIVELIEVTEKVVAEGNPGSTVALISEWERSVGLPDPCAGGPILILSRRRDAVVQRVGVSLGWTISALVAEAARAGYSVQIENAKTFDCESGTCESYFGDALWPASFIVHAPEITWKPLSFGCALGEPFADWGNMPLECVIRSVAPADKFPFFVYDLPAEPGPWPDADVEPGGLALEAPPLSFSVED